MTQAQPDALAPHAMGDAEVDALAARVLGGLRTRAGAAPRAPAAGSAAAAACGGRAFCTRADRSSPLEAVFVAEPAEAVAAVDGGASVVLLDNFAPGPALQDAVRAVRAAAKRRGSPMQIEASGGVRLENVRAFAECGVDRVSIGALTHSAPALDLSMLVEERR